MDYQIKWQIFVYSNSIRSAPSFQLPFGSGTRPRHLRPCMCDYRYGCESRYVQTLLMRNELRVSPRDYFESLVNSIFTELVDLILMYTAHAVQEQSNAT